MAVFVVTLENGPGFDASRRRREQPDWDAHAAFMDSLVEDGFVLLGGPLSDVDRDRMLLVVDAIDDEEIESRLEDDPWSPDEVLRTVSIEPWTLWLDGTQRGPGPSPARTSPVS
jgi:uncharacterized protein YciI